MDSSCPAVEAEHLSKFYGQVPGLNDLSMTVGTGEVRGLLGQNGSGKSTLLKTLLGLIHPSSGSVRVLGVDVQKAPIEVRRLVGYVPESPRLYEFLTATEYLDFVADVRGMGYEEKKERITRLIESLDLEGKQGETITGYSQGMKQKVAIMGAILHHPKILSRSLSTVLQETASLLSSVLTCLRLQTRSVTVSQYSRMVGYSRKAQPKSCGRKQVSPIPGSKTSSSN
jgi:ABC-2 type transport system ATP-binding protein